MNDEKFSEKLDDLTNNNQIDDALKLLMSTAQNESKQDQMTNIGKAVVYYAFAIMDMIRDDMVKQSFIVLGILTQNRFVEVEKQSNTDYHPYQKEYIVGKACTAVRKDEQRLGILEDILSLITQGYEAIEY